MACQIAIATGAFLRSSAGIYCLICCSFGSRWHAYAKSGGRESPGVRVTFFRVAERKSPKKGRPCCLRPLRCATGQPGVLGHEVHRGTRFALRAPLRQPRRARARSTRASTRVPPRALRAPGASRREPGERTSTRAIASLRCARPRLAGASATRCAGAAERSDGPNGCWLFDCPTPAGCACGGAVVGWHARRSARAS